MKQETRIKNAFTLTEILVVLAIVAIIAALIVSVFTRVKSSANKTVCLSNLSQIGKALALYSGDNSGLAPPYMVRSIISIDGPLVDGNPELWKNSLMLYAKADGIFYCPSDSHSKTDFQPECADRGNSLITSYETTPYVNGDIGENKSVIVSLDNPKYSEISYLQDRVCQGRNMKTGRLVFSTYHGETMNVLFLDSHVKHIKITD